jgi:hypothetical protein
MSSFPDDENGDVLRRMQEHGDDFSKARDVDFTVVFPSEHAAKAFANLISGKGWASSVEMTNCVAELPWDVRVVNHMVPTHAGISQFEAMLADEAKSFEGRNDGWGSLQQ